MDMIKKAFNWLRDRLSKGYKYVWHSIFQRDEPWTRQLTRMMIANGVFFWLGFLLIEGVCFYNIFVIQKFWQSFFSFAGLFTTAWLTDHLIDEAIKNPENNPK